MTNTIYVNFSDEPQTIDAKFAGEAKQPMLSFQMTQTIDAMFSGEQT